MKHVKNLKKGVLSNPFVIPYCSGLCIFLPVFRIKEREFRIIMTMTSSWKDFRLKSFHDSILILRVYSKFYNPSAIAKLIGQIRNFFFLVPHGFYIYWSYNYSFVVHELGKKIISKFVNVEVPSSLSKEISTKYTMHLVEESLFCN